MKLLSDVPSRLCSKLAGLALAIGFSALVALPHASGQAASSPEKSLVTRPDVQKALRFIQENHEANIEKQIAISQTPSSPFAEEQRGKFMAAEFKKLGLADVETDPIGNVLGWRRGTSPRTIVIAAHIDTVFPPGTDFTVKRTGTRLNGPGIQDDSRGLAVLLGLIEALNIGSIKTDYTLLFVGDVGEEGIGNLRGVKYLFTEGKYKDQLDAFISVDGTSQNVITNREIGSRRYLVTISGPGGHSAGNFGRPNPAHALGRVVDKISNLEVLSNPQTDRTSYNVGRIGGGTSVNSVPFEAWFEFDMRSVSEDELIKLEQKFLKIVDDGVAEENKFSAAHAKGAFAKGELTVEKKMIGLRHAIASTVNGGLVGAASESVRQLEFGAVSLVASSTDSNAVANAGKPAITVGGGGEAANAHSLQEWFDSKDAYKGIQALLLTVLNFDTETKK